MALLEHQVVRPRERRYGTPLLLLHGAWHGAWCWRDAMDDFAARGFEVHAISLRGHGESDKPRSLNLCGLWDYVRDLAAAVKGISPRPVVVGHSMGGYITQLYLTRAAANHATGGRPDRRPALNAAPLPGAVLLCSAPANGVLPFILRYARRHPLPCLRAVVTANLRHMVGTPDLARDAFFRDGTAPDRLERYTALLIAESLRVATEMSLTTFPDPGHNRSRVLVIAAERDRVFTLEEQRALAVAYGAELTIIPEAAHDLMLDPAWPQAAGAIERAVSGWTA
jgi:pimeloyl-ACP methyl ester carboxylesterase